MGPSIVFLCPARGIVGSHSCLSSTCTTHGPRFVGTRVTIDGTYPAHIFLTGVQAHSSQGMPGVCVCTLCGVALFALVLCCPCCLRHQTETMARTRVHAHTQNQPCPHGSCGAGSRAFWNMPMLHYPLPGCSVLNFYRGG